MTTIEAQKAVNELLDLKIDGLFEEFRVTAATDPGSTEGRDEHMAVSFESGDEESTAAPSHACLAQDSGLD
eukprot:CAMPEP_0194534494 /NCGR_PEP_ID=MMETSP0253-20130528/72705_1 /TAXON_ID=2966 /ORGANISM="Noctiluca scintillans" /LENGTH=70 /DNA_ID=CAMNT_0039380163 /DNA_START=5 /DNA_END=214 /DNA_ORIENTATION=-